MRSAKRQHRGTTPRQSDASVAERQRPRTPERRCIVSGEVLPTDDLIRFALGPEGVVPDLTGRLPGRGVWVRNAKSVLAAAASKNAFVRGFKQKVICPDDLADQVESLLHRRVLNLVSLANKAGEAVAGFSKVDAVLREGTCAVLLHASDGAEDGRRKLAGIANAGREIFHFQPKTVAMFTSDELSLAFGRGNVVHAALKQSGVSASFLKELARLNNYIAESGSVEQSAAAHEHCH